MARTVTPLLWLLFSAGGTIAALLFPVHLFLIGLAFPLGWLEAPTYGFLRSLVGRRHGSGPAPPGGPGGEDGGA